MSATVIVVDFTNAEIPDDEQALRDYFGLVKMPPDTVWQNSRVEAFIQHFTVVPPISAKCFRLLAENIDVQHLTIIFRGLMASFETETVSKESLDQLSAFYVDFFSKIRITEVPKIDIAVSIDNEVIADVYIPMGPFNAFLSQTNRDAIREQNKD